MNVKLNTKSQSSADRIRQLESELRILTRATALLGEEFGTDPKDCGELGYGLYHGARELRKELELLRERRPGGYNPFWSDCRRR